MPPPSNCLSCLFQPRTPSSHLHQSREPLPKSSLSGNKSIRVQLLSSWCSRRSISFLHATFPHWPTRKMTAFSLTMMRQESWRAKLSAPQSLHRFVKSMLYRHLQPCQRSPNFLWISIKPSMLPVIPRMKGNISCKQPLLHLASGRDPEHILSLTQTSQKHQSSNDLSEEHKPAPKDIFLIPRLSRKLYFAKIKKD
jgi:hypothetical protein